MEEQSFLRELFDLAVAAADPMVRLPQALPARPAGRVVVVGAGKASARMAEALEKTWGRCEGLVITRYGYARPTQGIEIVEAAHPVPDAAGHNATARMLAMLQALGEGDMVVALISGGASALLVQPAGAITLAEKQALNTALLQSGAAIEEMNTVRKHLSRVKGGQLAVAAYPAQVLSLMISDVTGDDPAFIGSGPTVGDISSAKEAAAILQRYAVAVPRSITDVLGGDTGVLPPDAPELSLTENRVIAAPSQSLAAAREAARAQGLDLHDLGDRIYGEAQAVGRAHAALALELQARIDRPLLILSGGECTVTGRGNGIGGPNAEYALALAIALKGAPGIYAIACDTDGVDGAAEVAGAVIGPETLARAKAAGAGPEDALSRHDSHGFFGQLGDQVVTGPTLTNVNDFRAILVQPQ